MQTQSFLYGAVLKLTREDTPEDIERNLIQMKEAGLYTVVVWPAAFWWEDRGEDYPIHTGKVARERAGRIGLGVIMELAGQLPMMEYIPDFLMKDEYYCTDEQGRKCVQYGSFGPLNYMHPELSDLICAHYEKTAYAYKDYPALIAYDVFNETAFNSYDKYTIEEFRAWLKRKYQTIDRLNDVWEHCYTDFSQISYTPWIWMSIMPAADFAAFRKEAVGIFLRRFGDAIRRADNTHPLIADNIGSMITNGTWLYERPQDEFVLRDAVDEIGMSFYPKQVSGCRPPHSRQNTFDAFYAASGRRGYYVSEMQTHIQALFNPSTAVSPYELKQWCCEALASGAKGLIYWMWRPFTKGLQTAGRGLVDYKNRSTPRLAFAREFSAVVGETGALTPPRARVGILFDGMCHDFQVCYTRCYDVDQNIYLNSLCGAYRAMYDAGVRADLVRMDEIGQYRVLILSNHIVIGKETAEALGDYVRNGGILVCDGKIGIVDQFSMQNDRMPGGALNPLMGLEYIDSDAENPNFLLDGKTICGYYGRELTALTDGRALACFADGYPAVVERTVERGKVLTVNTHLWYGYIQEQNNADAFAGMLAAAYDLKEADVTPPLKVRLAENEVARYAFVFNYTDQPVSGRISGGGFDEALTVAAHDVLSLREERR